MITTVWRTIRSRAHVFAVVAELADAPHYGDQDFAPVLFQEPFDQGVRDAREAEGVDERKRGSDPFLLRVQVVQELREPLGERAFLNMDIERGRKLEGTEGVPLRKSTARWGRPARLARFRARSHSRNA